MADLEVIAHDAARMLLAAYDRIAQLEAERDRYKEALEWVERFTSGSRGDARMMEAGQARYLIHRRAASALSPRSSTGEPCTDCDGRGHYTTWPHTTCPTCGGSGSSTGGRDGG